MTRRRRVPAGEQKKIRVLPSLSPTKERKKRHDTDLYLLRVWVNGVHSPCFVFLIFFFQLMNQPTENNHAMLAMLIIGASFMLSIYIIFLLKYFDVQIYFSLHQLNKLILFELY
jgi:hypothetical protein